MSQTLADHDGIEDRQKSLIELHESVDRADSSMAWYWRWSCGKRQQRDKVTQRMRNDSQRFLGENMFPPAPAWCMCIITIGTMVFGVVCPPRGPSIDGEAPWFAFG